MKIPNKAAPTANIPCVLMSSATVGPTLVEETIPACPFSADLKSAKVIPAGKSCLRPS